MNNLGYAWRIRSQVVVEEGVHADHKCPECTFKIVRSSTTLTAFCKLLFFSIIVGWLQREPNLDVRQEGTNPYLGAKNKEWEGFVLFIFKNGPIPATFLFSSFPHDTSQYKLIKS